jgi:hypothetical protein
VPWTRGTAGGEAPVALVFDGNDHGACRVTVGHHSFWGVEDRTTVPGAALWVRVGSDLRSDEAFAAWRSAFSAAKTTADVSADKVRVTAAGTEGPLTLAAAPPYRACTEMEPAHTRAVLALDGRDLGKAILDRLPCVQRGRKAIAAIEPVPVSPAKPAVWEAERGHVAPPMKTAVDDDAFGGRFVWMPGAPGDRGPAAGSVTWRLRVEKAGTYYLWGRVLAPSPTDDSFFVHASTDSAEPVPLTDWHTGTHTTWEWAPVRLGEAPGPTPLALPAGEVMLRFRAREDGTKIDRLYLSADPKVEP